MLFRTRALRTATAIAGTAMIVTLTACSSGGGSGGGGGGADGAVEIEWLVQNGGSTPAMAEAMIAAFEAENDDITVTMQTQPGGTEGDNLMKTKLATGEMSDLFHYNSGSLFQALNPNTTLVDLSDQPWVDDLTEDFVTVVSTDEGIYGAPIGSSFAGAVIYNKPIYEELGLEVPTTWDEFMANNEAIAAAGTAAPIIQTYGDTWTSQLFVLGDYANVNTADPDWAVEYTAGNRKYAEEPAIAGFQHQQDAFDAGFFNEDYASALYDDGIRMIATGEGAHYPILTNALATIQQNYPDNANDVGVFALPADDAANTSITIWQPNAVYIPQTTEGEKLEAAKEFVAFMTSPAGCEVQNETLVPSGPYVTSACSVPDDVPDLIGELQTYFDEEKTAPALEFLSPIKGPNLENITVQVGSGISTAEEGAALYDEDVKKQAQQLGLEGW
ncbi:ABC transporter substrate-binding protein [Planctomonas psychrotolerans]|uniref:ABC transporter substrate-binding protein n=1 Tax=Planctomonas psychrotolerans TaxID=2528712 RepID=UPI00123A4E43|nr:extracellular solute-binding protein [Planctomonas psychrotolerans]